MSDSTGPFEIALGIMGGSIGTMMAVAGLYYSVTEDISKELGERRTISGEVVDETMIPGEFLKGPKYILSVVPKGGQNRIAVVFDKDYGSRSLEAESLYGLLKKGDNVVLSVAEHPDISFDDQRLVGIEGRLDQ